MLTFSVECFICTCFIGHPEKTQNNNISFEDLDIQVQVHYHIIASITSIPIRLIDIQLQVIMFVSDISNTENDQSM